jgi:hypothetical protein
MDQGRDLPERPEPDREILSAPQAARTAIRERSSSSNS